LEAVAQTTEYPTGAHRQLGLVTPEAPTARLRYVVEVLFVRLLGLQVHLVQATESLQPNRQPAGAASVLLRDVLSEAETDWTFRCLTEAEVYANFPLDAHGRYAEASLEVVRSGRETEPSLHLLAEAVAAKLRNRFPDIQVTLPPYTTQFTLDLDNPFRFRGKPVHVLAGALAKRLLQFNFADAGRLVNTLLGAKDPYDLYDRLPESLPPHHTTIFLLQGGRTKHDNRITTRTRSWVKLIKRLHNMGYRMGIHPSYNAATDRALFAREYHALRQLLGVESIPACRMHYLRYRLPDTRRWMLELGIRHDYTTLLGTTNGFRHGMAVPFPWFDVAANHPTELLLHPTHTMDRTHQQYLQQTPERAVLQAEGIRHQVQHVGGTFTTLVHNELFAGLDEWRGWQPYVQWLRSLH
jgi:hypothetical protein